MPSEVPNVTLAYQSHHGSRPPGVADAREPMLKGFGGLREVVKSLHGVAAMADAALDLAKRRSDLATLRG